MALFSCCYFPALKAFIVHFHVQFPTICSVTITLLFGSNFHFCAQEEKSLPFGNASLENNFYNRNGRHVHGFLMDNSFLTILHQRADNFHLSKVSR